MSLSLLADVPSPWLAVFGRSHPVLLHAPLGIVPAIAALEFGAVLLRRQPPRGAITALAWLAALAAAAAAASGLVLAGEPGYGGDTVGQHKIAGLAFAGLSLAAALASFRAARGVFRLLLLLALGAMVPAGHLGGTLTHGADFLFEPLRRAEAPKAAPSPTGQSEFRATIQPILERVCTNCHNPDKRKGELLLTTVDGIRKGGENGAVLVPGKPDESPLLTRCELPADHDDHMPPDGKPQPTAAELQALRAWIAAGAKMD
jgi:hypothetical protein